MTRRILLAALASGLLFGSLGCRHCCRRQSRNEIRPIPGDFLERPGSTRGGDVLIPPPNVQSGGDFGGPPASIPDTPRSPSNFRPEVKPEKEILLPDPFPPTSSAKPKASPLLEVPTFGARLEEPARTGASKSPNDLPPITSPSPTTAKAATNPMVQTGYYERKTAPAGVPGFAVVNAGLANGRKPNVDGFDGLRSGGYKTAIYLHAPEADVSATRNLVEKKGMKFVGVPVSADNWKAGYGSFAEAIGVKEDRPAFVFDDDGVRTGCLWYAYFRNVESLGDDAAQVRAAPLGLRDATAPERLKFWQAMQDASTKR